MTTLPVSLTHNEKILGWSFWGLQQLVLPAAISLLVPAFAPGMNTATRNFLYLAVSFLMITAVMLRFLRQSLRVFIQRPFYALRWAFIPYLVYWVSYLSIRFLLATFVPTFRNINDATIFQLLQENAALTSIGVILLAPIAEELFYRGVIFGTFHPHNRLAAYALSCIAFSAVHLAGYMHQADGLTLVLCFVQYLPAGLCLAWSYDRSGTIWAPILMHIAINQTGILSWR